MHRLMKYAVAGLMAVQLTACDKDPTKITVENETVITVRVNGSLVNSTIPLICGESVDLFVTGEIGTVVGSNLVTITQTPDPNGGTWIKVTAKAGSSGNMTVKITSADGSSSEQVAIVITCPQGPTGQAPVLTFSANPMQITLGQSSTLMWNCTPPAGVTLTASNSWSGQKQASGSESVTPPTVGTFVYTLTCANQFGVDTKTTTITVIPGQQPLRQCADGIDNADPEDQLADAQDPGCHTDGNPNNPGSYNPNDDDETNTPVGNNVYVNVTPETAQCMPGEQETFSATVWNVPSGGRTDVSWQVSNLQRASIASQNGNNITLNCLLAGQVTVTATSFYDPTKSDFGTLTVGTVTNTYTISPTGPFALVCVNGQGSVTVPFQLRDQNGNVVTNGVTWNIAGTTNNSSNGQATWNAAGTYRVRAMVNGVVVVDQNVQVTGNCTQQPVPCSITSIDYTPGGGNVSAGQNRTLSLTQQTNWPTNCQVVWYTEQRSLVRVNGELVYQIGGEWYYAGRNATLSVVQGAQVGRTAVVCAHLITIGPDGRWMLTNVRQCYNWTITS